MEGVVLPVNILIIMGGSVTTMFAYARMEGFVKMLLTALERNFFIAVCTLASDSLY